MNIQLFNVAPNVPPPLRFLENLAYNMWWCWNPEAIELFRRISPEWWRDSGHNPLEFLSRLPQKRLEGLTADEGFRSHLARVRERFESDVAAGKRPQAAAGRVAYFSLEYGIHESVKLYSGGLGILAGDHLKAASDMNLPLVAMGLLYRQGYFQQYLNDDGWQQEHYPENQLHLLPVRRATDSAGNEVTITLPLPEGELKAIVWRLDVGTVPLYLLDANIHDNPPDFRSITAQLYGGDRRMRLRQELLLAIGGFRALLALGHEPHVCHINEGHAAFLSVARIAHLMDTCGLELQVAAEIVYRTNVFTTHTPLPVGNESFAVDLVRPHLEALRRQLGIAPETVVAWGQPPGRSSPELSMTILGLRMSQYCNGVSQLHGKVARKMWAFLWPDRPDDEIPIGHVTNGIHLRSWLSPDSTTLYDRYLGPGWDVHSAAPGVISNIENIPDEELWRAHELNRARLVRTARELLERQFRNRNAPRTDLLQAKACLDHNTLTIGFARRFVDYKRATLLFHNPERLEALLVNEEHPVQIIFAGKAHPQDNQGKDLIRQITHFARKPSVRKHIVFIENYDLFIARRLVQGVDVWLNTPVRPLEASGTSGMKAAVNGGIHASVLDGWWCEGYSPESGWAIGSGEEYEDRHYQDAVESHALYNLLENDIIPCYYDRTVGDLPVNWLRLMKGSIRMAIGYFTSHRMLAEYQQNSYGPAQELYRNLTADSAALAKQLVKQRLRIEAVWGKVRIDPPTADRQMAALHVGDTFHVTVTVNLGGLEPDEVDVQVYYGPVDSQNRITESHVVTMDMVEPKGDGVYLYRGAVTCQTTGRYGFAARVTPRGPEWKSMMPGFVTWADGGAK